MELSEQEKTEYKLIETFYRTPELRLWCYDPRTSTVTEVVPQKVEKATAKVVWTEDGYTLENHEKEKLIVDAVNYYFEALNIDNATQRVAKYRVGKIKELCNFRRPTGNAMKLG